MKINICDKCGKEETCALGADGKIKEFKYGPALLQLCPDCKRKVDASAAKFIYGGKHGRQI